MEFRALEPYEGSALEELFVAVFSSSYDEQEGALVGRLVKALIGGTDSEHLYGFSAVDQRRIVGAILFSRLTFDRPLEAFILAPVAVRGDHQGLGVGQALISHGLREMAREGVDFVVTYGDPAFYSKVGFRPISQDVVRPPHELSQPEGWLGQSLSDIALETVSGRCSCVKALDDPAYW